MKCYRFINDEREFIYFSNNDYFDEDTIEVRMEHQKVIYTSLLKRNHGSVYNYMKEGEFWKTKIYDVLPEYINLITSNDLTLVEIGLKYIINDDIICL